jgi:hypothetical protein
MKAKLMWWSLALSLIVVLPCKQVSAQSLGGSFIRSAGAGSSKAYSAPVPQQLSAPGWFLFYRALSFRSEHRSCRLHPTCSAFALRAVRRWGWVGGWLKTIARLQMEHGEQGGFLGRKVASDGGWIYPETEQAWEHP